MMYTFNGDDMTNIHHQQVHPNEAAASASPVLNLLMRPEGDTTWSLPVPITTDTVNEMDRSLKMLKQQEEYRCGDYLARQYELATEALDLCENTCHFGDDHVIGSAEEENTRACIDASSASPKISPPKPRPVSPHSQYSSTEHEDIGEDSSNDQQHRATATFPSQWHPSGAVPVLTRSEFLVDAVCREKMCEWSYRVCDHFGANRDIVAVSFSYLDRFVDRLPCCCDRSTFKLAAMTTLYLASKVYHTQPLASLSDLSELSRGEFGVDHMVAMEEMVLHALGWRLHPPTAQCFISTMSGLLPVGTAAASCSMMSQSSSASASVSASSPCPSQSPSSLSPPSCPIRSSICQRALFFAELCLYDYTFVTCDRSLVAVAALLNAMEGMDESLVSLAHQSSFLHALRVSTGVEYGRDVVDQTRNRLWYVYGLSAQYREDGVAAARAASEAAAASSSPSSPMMLMSSCSGPSAPLGVYHSAVPASVSAPVVVVGGGGGPPPSSSSMCMGYERHGMQGGPSPSGALTVHSQSPVCVGSMMSSDDR